MFTSVYEMDFGGVAAAGTTYALSLLPPFRHWRSGARTMVVSMSNFFRLRTHKIAWQGNLKVIPW